MREGLWFSKLWGCLTSFPPALLLQDTFRDSETRERLTTAPDDNELVLSQELDEWHSKRSSVRWHCEAEVWRHSQLSSVLRTRTEHMVRKLAHLASSHAM